MASPELRRSGAGATSTTAERLRSLSRLRPEQGHGLDEAQLAVAHRKTTIFVSSVFTQHRLGKGCPCQDLLQPCGHEEAVDSSLEIFNLQSFTLALALQATDTVRSFKPNTLSVRWALARQCDMRFLLELLGTVHEECSNCRGRSGSLFEIMQIVTSAVCVFFFLAVHCSIAKDDGFQWPDASEIFLMQSSYRGESTKAFTLKCISPQVF